MAQIEKMKDTVQTEQSGGLNILRHFATKRSNGSKILWAKPWTVVVSSLQFAIFVSLLGCGCWALNRVVMYLVGLMVR